MSEKDYMIRTSIQLTETEDAYAHWYICSFATKCKIQNLRFEVDCKLYLLTSHFPMMRCRRYLHWKLIPKFHRARHKVPQESKCSKPSAIDEVKMKIKSFTSSVMEKFSTRQYIERLPWALPMINRVIRYIGMQHPSARKTGQASQKVPGHWKFERLFLECGIMEQVDTYLLRRFSSEMSTNSRYSV